MLTHFVLRPIAIPIPAGGSSQSLLGSSVSVGIAQCKQLKMSNTFCLTALLTASSGGNTFLCLVQITNSGTLGSSLSKMLTNLVLWHTTFTCASKPGCLMSHIWLHTPDCKALNVVFWKCLTFLTLYSWVIRLYHRSKAGHPDRADNLM